MSDNNNVTFYIYILFVLFHLHSYTTGLPCNQKKTATSKGQRSKCRKRKRSDESSGEEWQPWKEEEKRRRSTRKTGRKREGERNRGMEGEREEKREGESEEERERR